MKELQEILKRISQFKENEKAILATVVDVVGSGYRRAGARMLIDENGNGIGTVSGGCLEADVLERAKKVLQTGEPTVITYDTTQDEKSLFGLGMGCRGVIKVLLEPIQSDYLDFLKNCYEKRETGVVATLIERIGEPSWGTEDWKIGSRMFLESSLKVTSNFNDAVLWRDLFDVSIETLKEGKSRLVKFDMPGVLVDKRNINIFFFEFVSPPLNLFLFGAGFDALPVVRFAKELGWRVMVVDHRAAFANSERLPEADEIIVSRSEDLPEALFKDENSVAVIMTHNYERDLDILHKLLNSNCRYIGALGPKSRTEKLISELREAGRTFNELNLKNLYAPVGLDIGSETPEEIALAVVAEIKSTLANRDGGFLRERKGSISGF